MITAHHISKSYSINQILSDVSFFVKAGERAGLIGPNGCGNTTLLKILAGLERADSGAITHNPSDLKSGTVPAGARKTRGSTSRRGTIIAVVHDRYFINRFATELWVLENRAIRRELLLS